MNKTIEFCRCPTWEKAERIVEAAPNMGPRAVVNGIDLYSVRDVWEALAPHLRCQCRSQEEIKAKILAACDGLSIGKLGVRTLVDIDVAAAAVAVQL